MIEFFPFFPSGLLPFAASPSTRVSASGVRKVWPRADTDRRIIDVILVITHIFQHLQCATVELQYRNIAADSTETRTLPVSWAEQFCVVSCPER
jgi:hypothetical protein